MQLNSNIFLTTLFTITSPFNFPNNRAVTGNPLADPMQAYLDRLRKLSEAVDNQEGAVHETLSKTSMAAANQMVQVGEALTALNEVLRELDGKQVVIQKQKTGWFGRSARKSNGHG